MKKWTSLGCLLLITATILLGCTNSPTPQTPTPIPDPWTENWFMHPVCSLPCVANITPGVTTVEEAADILKNMDEVTEVSGPTKSENFGYYEVYWKAERSGGHIYSRKDSNIVNEMTFGIDDGIEIKDLFAVYGEPSHMIMHTCSYGVCLGELLYADQGMDVLVVPPKEKGKFSISPDLRPENITIFEPGGDVFENKVSIMNIPLDNFPWDGYGLYTAK